MSCRVTIVGTRQRLDADLPDSIPVAELLADVAGLLGENQNGAGVEWGLLRVGGSPLDPELSLADQGVSEGTMLFLRDVAEAPPPPEIADIVEQVAVAVDAQKGRWNASLPAALLAWVAAVCLGASGLVVLVAGDASGRATAGIIGASIGGLAAFALVRLARRPVLGTVVALSTVPAWTAAGAGVAVLAGAHGAMVVAFGLAGAAIGGLVSYAVAGESAIPLADGVVEATAVPSLVLFVVVAFGGGLLQGAAALAVLEVVALAGTPLLTARLIRSIGPDAADLVRRLGQGRRVDAAAAIASSLAIVASCAVLATSGGWFARGLILATAAATALRARHHRFALEVTPLLAAALASLVLLELPFAVWLAIGVRGAAGLGLLLIGDAVALVAAAVAVRRWVITPQAVRWLGPLEFAAVAATVPLALGALGLYDAVAHFARGLG